MISIKHWNSGYIGVIAYISADRKVPGTDLYYVTISDQKCISISQRFQGRGMASNFLFLTRVFNFSEYDRLEVKIPFFWLN